MKRVGSREGICVRVLVLFGALNRDRMNGYADHRERVITILRYKYCRRLKSAMAGLTYGISDV